MFINITMDFGARLAELLKEHNLVQATLAKHIDVSQRAVSKWLNHQSEPTASSIIKCAKFFAVSTDYLLGVADED